MVFNPSGVRMVESLLAVFAADCAVALRLLAHSPVASLGFILYLGTGGRAGGASAHTESLLNVPCDPDHGRSSQSNSSKRSYALCIAVIHRDLWQCKHGCRAYITVHKNENLPKDSMM